ncbi:MAG: nucleoside phosphorylase [Acetobacteraceae bacterium]
MPPSPPLLAAKDYAMPSVFQARNLLREARRQKHLPELPVPAICLLDPDGDAARRLGESGRGERSRGWACYHTELLEFSHGGRQMGVVGRAVGGAFAVLVAEQLFASGCQLLVSVTSAGRLRPAAETDSFMLIERALRDEGTSYHYLAPAAFSCLERRLGAAVMAALERASLPVPSGGTWTTDAPFRETEGAIARARALGLIGVEMEAAALYAFAAAQRRPVVCFAHLTNELAQVAGDFEKGKDEGLHEVLAILAACGEAWAACGEPSTEFHEARDLRSEEHP